MIFLLQGQLRVFPSCVSPVSSLSKTCLATGGLLTMGKVHLTPWSRVWTACTIQTAALSARPHPTNRTATSMPHQRTFLYQSVRYQVQKSKDVKEVIKKQESGQVSTATKVKEAGKDATYGLIFIVGIGVTALMFYAVGRELFSSQSPSGVYGTALKRCKANDELVTSLGEPIKGYGEMNRRGRARYVSHTLYEKNGVPHMRMQFYVEGPHNKGTVHVDVNKDGSRKWKFTYIFVELERYPKKSIVIEDNR